MATQPTNTSDIGFLQLKWDFKLIDVYTRLGKSKSSSIIISKDKKSKNIPKVCKEFSYIPIHSEDPFMKLDSLIKTNHNMYELIPDEIPRHFYIDCDIKEDNDIFSLYDYPKIIKLLTSGIFHIMQHISFDSTLQDNNTHNLFSAFTVENDEHKQSCHIIFPTINLQNVKDTKHFALILKHYIEDEDCDWLEPDEREILSKTMDYKVYSSNQNFRLPLQTKLGKDDSYRLMPYNNIVCITFMWEFMKRFHCIF